jgi:hypothetical protein
MPVRALPENPNLEHLKYQARDLLRDLALRSTTAAQRIREFHPNWRTASDPEIFAVQLHLSDAQLAIAREYGFASWTRLKRRVEKPKVSDDVTRPHHERIEDQLFRRGVELIDTGDVEGLRAHLKKYPELTRQKVEFEGGNYFRNPSLLEFIAENPVRHGKIPDNIFKIAEVILDAGAEQSAIDETLMLVATGSVPRECREQIPLIRLLCDRGADPNRAAEVAAVLFERQAVAALMVCGARMTLPLAATMGEYDQMRSLLPNAGPHERQLALALAAQYGYAYAVEILLDGGEDPNRFNPIGGHSHSTPLHQAAGNGHLDVVKLLVARGAKIDVKDILFGGTPLDWAKYGGKTEVEEFLRGKTA